MFNLKSLFLLFGLLFVLVNNALGQREGSWILTGTYRLGKALPQNIVNQGTQNLLLSFRKDSLFTLSLAKGLYKHRCSVLNDSLFVLINDQSVPVGIFKKGNILWLFGGDETVEILKRAAVTSKESKETDVIKTIKNRAYLVKYQDLFGDRSTYLTEKTISLKYIGQLKSEEAFHNIGEYSLIFSINKMYFALINRDDAVIDRYGGEFIFQIKELNKERLVLISYINGEHDVELRVKKN